MRLRAGHTLLELMVAIAIIGSIAAVVTMSMDSLHVEEAAPDNARTTAAAARRQAAVRGRPHTVVLHYRGAAVEITAMPDGRVVSPGGIPIEMLNGAWID